jgi:hypothetical protein
VLRFLGKGLHHVIWIRSVAHSVSTSEQHLKGEIAQAPVIALTASMDTPAKNVN